MMTKLITASLTITLAVAHFCVITGEKKASFCVGSKLLAGSYKIRLLELSCLIRDLEVRAEDKLKCFVRTDITE